LRVLPACGKRKSKSNGGELRKKSACHGTFAASEPLVLQRGKI
jgi:hypothetical protein